MRCRETNERLAAQWRKSAALRGKMRALQASVGPEEVADYVLAGADDRPVRQVHLWLNPVGGPR